MFRAYLKTAFFTLIFSAFATAQAQDQIGDYAFDKEVGSNEGKVNTKEEIDSYIDHHLKDAHDFHLFSYTDDTGERNHVGFPLPVIVWSSEGPKAFMSSKFHHDDDGKELVRAGDATFTQLHSKIYELENGATSINFDEEHHPTNAHRVFDMSITKSVFGLILIGLFMLLVFGGLAKQYKNKSIPTGFGRVLEPLVLYVRDEIAKPNIGEQKYRKYMGYLLTVFFLIWIGNLLGLTPFGFNITGQIAVTVCLALFTFIIVQFSGNKDYWKHIFWMPGVPILMKIALIPIEIIGLLTKPFSLTVRLFANITAGHVVVMGLIALMITLKAQFGMVGSTGLALFLTLFLSVIELLVAFLQAFIFTMLSALFIGMAVAEHDHPEHAGAEEDDIDEVRERFV
ncbi:F0F1 ATP synthase subunit A [Nonlabens sp. Ci31]|jgi:F-type H+-transporting ATPase subunit a|uniref:F0F1 ATP synthase subunit A n=1 Tax=Nonlabens sp. Ci31 TaxID=2608253 RepID=UPI0014631D0E|nr:F0F1 ATP synthase subunit A [Nonlabens sp. Ci31]QJP33839.1 F0F1 ATP synthase subunit A [Nonlabens sp. Ci31]